MKHPPCLSREDSTYLDVLSVQLEFLKFHQPFNLVFVFCRVFTCLRAVVYSRCIYRTSIQRKKIFFSCDEGISTETLEKFKNSHCHAITLYLAYLTCYLSMRKIEGN